MFSLAAEASGVNRSTFTTWIRLGDQGDPRYAAFAAECRRIRAVYMLKEAQFLATARIEDREASKNKMWLLSKMDREIFDPPKEVYEKRTKTEDRSPLPQDAEMPAVQNALDLLSQAPRQH